MKKKIFLKDFSEMADMQINRLAIALDKIESHLPLTAKKLETSDNMTLAYLDMLTTRFSKVQDIIASKLFPLLLNLLGEDTPSPFIDKLNQLEKLGYIDSSEWWLKLREIRNQITHDYPNNNMLIAKHLNELIDHAEALIKFWGDFKIKLAKHY